VPARSLPCWLGAAILLLVASGADRAAPAPEPCDGDCATWADELNLLDVKKFGAKGDGLTDDTRAIRAAIAAAENQRPVPVYFPEGVYRISDTLRRTDADGHPTNALNLLGASRDTTFLRLADSAPGFEDPGAPKAMIFTASHLWRTGPSDGGKDWIGKGEGNQAFENYVANLTVDVGTGNPGAVGIDYLSNNIGSLRNLRVVDRDGVASVGIAMTRKWPGPALLSDVEIDGFETGIEIAQTEYSITIDTLTLVRQRRVGLRNRSNSVAIRKLSVRGTPSPVENLGQDALMVVVGADLVAASQHDPQEAAFANEGYLHLRGVHLGGFRAALTGIAAPPGPVDGVYRADAPLDGCEAPLFLPLRDIPDWKPPDETGWASVRAFGAIPGDDGDDTEAINRAFASGNSAIVFPFGTYDVSGPLRVPGAVRRILGLHSEIRIATSQPSEPVIQVDGGGDPLTLEGVDITRRGSDPDPAAALIAHTGARPLVLRDILSPPEDVMVSRGESGGELFVEDVCCGRMIVAGKQPVWARQFNTEGVAPRVVVDGTPLSILGLKTELAATVIDARHGAQIEVLGGLLYPVRPVPATLPAFRSSDGGMVLSYAESGYAPGTNYTVHIEERVAGSVRLIPAERFPPRLKGRLVACFDTRDRK
jgi:hypothetical protein